MTEDVGWRRVVARVVESLTERARSGGQTVRPPPPYAHVRLRVLQPPTTPHVHAQRRRSQTRTPHSMKAFEVERRSEEGPFRKDVGVSQKEEPSCAVTLFQETEDGLDKSFAPPIKVLRGIGRRYLSVALQQGLVFAHPDGTAVDALGALAEGRAGAADLALGSVASELVAVLVLERVLVTEHLPLRAKVGVGLGLVGEVVFMVWRKTPAVMGLGHQHLVAGRVAISKVGPRMVSGIGKGRHTFDRSGVLSRRFYHGDELGVVVRPGGHFDSGYDHSGPRATAACLIRGQRIQGHRRKHHQCHVEPGPSRGTPLKWNRTRSHDPGRPRSRPDTRHRPTREQRTFHNLERPTHHPHKTVA